MQLLANASSLLTSQDLALPPNDPRVFLPTPFAPGQSAATLLERELQRKKQQENEEWNALQSKTTLSSQAAVSASTQVAGSAQSQAQMRLQTSPFVMQQQLQLGRGQPRPTGISAHDLYFQQQLQPQQRFLNLQQQLSSGGGLLNPQQINPIQRQRMYAPNAPPLSFHQSNMNDMSILNDMSIPALMGVGVGIGLPQLDAFGGTASNAMMNNFIPGFMPNNVASALAFTANNGMGMDTTRLNWLLQQHPYEEDQIPALTTQIRNHKKAKAPKERAATKTAAKRTDRGNSNEPPRPNRWTQRYNELLEFKRIEGHCRVPHGYPPNKKLSWWVMNQRAQHTQRQTGKSNWLTDERIKLLEDIGFVWSPNARRSVSSLKAPAKKARKVKVMDEEP
eukprot:scaffold10166_cov127-Skeletonema_marinoi.AAC.7